MKIFKIIVILFLFTGLYPGCEKEEQKEELAAESTNYVSLLPVYKITGVSAESGGEINLPASFTAECAGLCWSENPDPTIKDAHSVETKAVNFTSQMTGLNVNTTYYVRAYIKCSGKIYYSAGESFKTRKFAMVNVSTESDWNYWMVGSRGESFFIKLENDLPSGLYYKPALDQEGFTILLDDYGRPAKIVNSGNLLILKNFNNYSADVTAVMAWKEIKIFKGIQFPVSWSLFSKINPVLRTLRLDQIKILAAGIGNMIGLVKGIQSRGMEMISSLPDQSELQQVLSSAAPEDLQEISPSAATLRICNQLAGCAAITDINCFAPFASRAASFMAVAKQVAENNKEAAQLADLQLSDPSLVIDVDGNVYHTIRIGNQTWMQENLRVTHYRNGDPVLQHVSNSEWMLLQAGALSFYSDDYQQQLSYGALYNWYVVDDPRNIAPVGYHVPSVEEFYSLINFLSSEAGGKLKEQNTIHWLNPNTGATNESAFSALPGGFRGDVCRYLGLYGWWYSSTTQNAASMGLALTYDNEKAGIFKDPRLFMGYSIRCLKD